MHYSAVAMLVGWDMSRARQQLAAISSASHDYSAAASPSLPIPDTPEKCLTIAHLVDATAAVGT